MAVFINCFVRKDKSIKLGNTTVRLEVITMDFLKLYSKWKFSLSRVHVYLLSFYPLCIFIIMVRFTSPPVYQNGKYFLKENQGLPEKIS